MEQGKTSVWKALIVPGVIILLFVLAILGIVFIRGQFTDEIKVETALPEISTTTEEKTTITGKTDPKATLIINGEKVRLEKNGDFRHVIILKSGENKIVLESRKGDNSKSISRVIVRETQEPIATNTSGNSFYSGELANSGPKENFAIFIITALSISVVFYYKSLLGLKKPSYKHFT